MKLTKGVGALLSGILVLGLTGCGDSGEQSENTNYPVVEETEASSLETMPTVASVGEILESMETEELEMMGLTLFDTVDELKSSVGFEVLTLEGLSKDVLPDTYETEEVSQEFGNATVRYRASSDSGDKVIVVRSGKSDDMQVFTQGRTAEADVVVGDSVVVSMMQDQSASTIFGWWSCNDLTYTIDMENLTMEEFSDIIMNLAEQTIS